MNQRRQAFYGKGTSLWVDLRAARGKITTRGTSHPLNYCVMYILVVGRDSSVGIATRYGLDGPGIEFRWGRDFPHPSRPSLGPTQPPVQWVPGISRR